MGVPVARYRAAVFVLSSMYAGLAGVLLALVFQRTVPDYFGMTLSLEYLAMIVIGGLGSVAGAVVGAAFVSLLPQLLTRYSDALPLVSDPGTGGIAPGEASRYPVRRRRRRGGAVPARRPQPARLVSAPVLTATPKERHEEPIGIASPRRPRRCWPHSRSRSPGAARKAKADDERRTRPRRAGE